MVDYIVIRPNRDYNLDYEVIDSIWVIDDIQLQKKEKK